MQMWLMVWGNAVGELDINGRGQVTAIWPWRWDRVFVTRAYEGGPLQYQYRLRNGELSKAVPANRMLHLRGMGIDGIVGMNPVETHKQTIGLSQAITEHGAHYYGLGTKMGGIIQGPAGSKLSDKAFERLDKTIRDQHEGISNAWRTLILEDGFQWKEAADNMVNAAFIPSLTMTAQDIARIYKVPLHRLGLLPAAPSANVEEMSLEYVLYTLSPWCANWQNQIHCDLLSSRENQSIFTAFDFKSLLIGNHKDMAAFIAALQDRGDLSADEVRELFLGMNAQPDGVGADYWKAVNMAPVGDEGKNSLTSPANAQQVQKVKKKEPKDDSEPPKKTNGHAAMMHNMGAGDNFIRAFGEFMVEQYQKMHQVN
jgi:HK97 family phage portal protein